MPSLETRNSQETLKKISLKKLPRILHETTKKKKKKPKNLNEKNPYIFEEICPKVYQ